MSAAKVETERSIVLFCTLKVICNGMASDFLDDASSFPAVPPKAAVSNGLVLGVVRYHILCGTVLTFLQHCDIFTVSMESRG